MRKIAFVLTLLALTFSPLAVSQANAAPAKHRAAVKHHRKVVKKKVVKRFARRHHGKANT